MLAAIITMLTSINSLTTRIHNYFDEVHNMITKQPIFHSINITVNSSLQAALTGCKLPVLAAWQGVQTLRTRDTSDQGTSAPVPKSVQGMLIEMLKSNFLDNRLPKRKKRFLFDYRFSHCTIPPHCDSHLNAASFDRVWMHGEIDLPRPPRASTYPLFRDRLCLLLPGRSAALY